MTLFALNLESYTY